MVRRNRSLFAWQPGIINSKSKLGRGIDIKTSGGYVVAPRSRVRQDGASGIYRWVRSPLGDALPRLPQWAVEALKPKPQPIIAPRPINAPKDISALVRFVANAKEGERNKSLHWAACRAAEAGLLDGAARQTFMQAALAAGETQRKALSTLASAATKAKIA